jgi:simple sugar transport system permease protein
MSERQVTTLAGDTALADRASPAGDLTVQSALKRRLAQILRRPAIGAVGGTVLVYAFFAITAAGHGFVSTSGTTAWLDPAAELGVVAIPVGLLMIAGEFDLSIASVISMSSLTVAVGSGHYGLPVVVSILIALAIAAVIGFTNGIVTVRTGLPSFIVTLGSYLAVGGLELYLTRIMTSTTAVSVTASGWVHGMFAGSADQFNVSIAWCAAIALCAGYVLYRTVFGNWVLATGGDKESARTAGVPTHRVKVTLFVSSALGAALLGGHTGDGVQRGPSRFGPELHIRCNHRRRHRRRPPSRRLRLGNRDRIRRDDLLDSK